MPAASSGIVRPTVATVRLDAIQANFAAVRRLLDRTTASQPSGSRRAAPGIIAVIKANAYGHGATEVARALESAGASMVACADIEEGVALRDASVTIPILVFGAASRRQSPRRAPPRPSRLPLPIAAFAWPVTSRSTRA
jgi:alanine racemase